MMHAAIVPHPRGIEVLTSPEFTDYKKTILSLMHKQVVGSQQDAKKRIMA